MLELRTAASRCLKAIPPIRAYRVSGNNLEYRWVSKCILESLDLVQHKSLKQGR
jgi:hypothetical protein